MARFKAHLHGEQELRRGNALRNGELHTDLDGLSECAVEQLQTLPVRRGSGLRGEFKGQYLQW